MEKTRIKSGNKRFSKLTRGIICFLFSAILLANVFPAYAAEVTVDASAWIFDLSLMSISADNTEAAAKGSAKAGPDGVISFSATGHTKDGCKDTDRASTTTITLKNITPAQITVSYTSTLTPVLTNATVEQVDGVNIATVESQGTLAFSVTSGTSSDSTVPASVTVTAVAPVASDTLYTTEFKTVTYGGSYTVSHNEETLTVPGSYERTNAIAYVLNATPSAGCTFVGWKNSSGVIFSTSASTTYTSISNNTIQPVFRPDDAATFFIKGNENTTYRFFDEAINAAGNSGMIIVSQSGTAYHSNWSNVGTNVTFEIGKNVKLLVPYSNAYEDHFGGSPNAYISQEDGISKYNNGGLAARNFAYCTLTIPTGSKLECNGSINVDGQRQNDGQPFTGVSLGGYGKIILGEEVTTGKFTNPEEEDLTAQLVIKNGGFLYCYGYITGTGMVEVESEGTIHELMQICDWPGGSAAMGSTTSIGKNCWYESADQNTLFLLSQFYVQSVEAPLKLCYGANEYVEAILTAGLTKLRQSVPFAGASKGLIQLQTDTSYLLRVYDQFADRMNYHVNGKCVLGGVTIDGIGSIKLASSNYVLPINGSYTFIIESGSELTIGNKMALLPGSEIIVETGSTVNVSEQVYIVEYGDFTETHFMHRATMKQDTDTITNGSPNNAPVPYVATLNRTSPRSENCIEIGYTTSSSGAKTAQYYLDVVNFKVDPVVVNNGTINVTGNGAVYSTASDGTAVVTGTGAIIYNGSTAAGLLKAGKGETLKTITTKYGANIAGVGKNQCFSTGTYYGQSNNYWYNHVITADTAETLAALTPGTISGFSGTTVTRYNPETKTTETIENVIGVVSYYITSNTTKQSAISFTMPASETVSAALAKGTAVLGSAVGGLDGPVTYALTDVKSDAVITIKEVAPTTVWIMAANAGNAPIESRQVALPAGSDMSGYFSNLECNIAATADNIGGTVYSPTNAIAAIGPEAGSYTHAYMNIQAAVAAATGSDDYVTVLQNRTLTDPIVVAEGQNITLDLGGKTITSGSEEPLTNNGTLILKNGTVTASSSFVAGTDMTIENARALIRNNGTIVSFWDVSTKLVAQKQYNVCLLNSDTGSIEVIGGNTSFAGASESTAFYGFAIANFGEIGTIGVEGGTITIKARRGIYTKGSAAYIEAIGGTNSEIILNCSQYPICIGSGTKGAGTIGMSGSTIDITIGSSTSSYDQHGIYVASPVTTIGDTGSTITISLSTKNTTQTAYGIICKAAVGTIGAANSKIEINVSSRSTAYGINFSGAIGTIGEANSEISITVASKDKNAYGIYCKANAETIGETNSKISITVNTENTTSTARYAYGMYIDSTSSAKVTVKAIGKSGSEILIKTTFTGTGKGADRGIINKGTITALGAEGATIEIVSNYTALSNYYTSSSVIGKISAMKGNIVLITTMENGDNNALRNAGTISTLYSGFFYDADGESGDAVYNDRTLNYASGYGLSTDKVLVTLKDGTTYPCYYVKATTPSFDMQAANVVLGNNLDMMFGFTYTGEDTTGYYVKAVRTYANGDPAEEIIYPATQWGNRDGYYMVTYGGFAAKEMCDTIYLMVCNKNGACVSDIWTDSIQSYSFRMLEDTTDADAALRTVVVDMLNYGAACQTALGYPAEAPAAETLATNGLTEAQKAWATVTMTEVKDEFAADREGESTTWYASNLVTTSNIQYGLAFQGVQDGMYVVYSFDGHKGNSVTSENLYVSEMKTNTDGYHYTLMQDLVVADARCPITVTVYDANGTEIDTWQESIEAYIARMAGSDAVFTAFMKFADSAYTYLHSK